MSPKSPIPVSQDKTTAPVTGFSNLRQEIERLFDTFEPVQWFDRMTHMGSAPNGRGPLIPAIDLIENDKTFTVTAEMPGLDPASIDVKIGNGMLNISGEKVEQSESSDENYHLSERCWGRFQRSMRMPENVDQDKITASYANGVLTLSLPKSAAAIASERKIEVKAA